MKVIIPMAGTGNRFREAGYQPIKPLIEVDGKPVIEHILDMYPKETNFLFIINVDHAKQTPIKQVLKKLMPSGKIVEIIPHKDGPVQTILAAEAAIPDNEPVIINYCDFRATWDYEGFKKVVQEKKCDGAIPCYKDFHPHLIHKKCYASVLADKDNFMTDIKEKHSFTENPMDCYQSCGIYYFKTGALLKKYAKELEQEGIKVNNEQYISMIYYLLKRDQLPVYIYPIDYFLQWGTPEDLEEYETWSRLFAKVAKKEKGKTTIPQGRDPNYQITLEKDSEEYKKSFTYWSKYFTKCKHHPYTEGANTNG